MSKSKPKYEILIRNVYERLQDVEHDVHLLKAYTVDSDRSPDEDYYMCNAAQNVVSVLCEIKENAAKYIDAIEYVKGNKKRFFVVIQGQIVLQLENYGAQFYFAEVREGYSVQEVEKTCSREIDIRYKNDERYHDAERHYFFRVLADKYDTTGAAEKIARAMSEEDMKRVFEEGKQAS